MFKAIVVLALLGNAQANKYHYQPNGCERGKLIYETNDVYTDEPCAQMSSSDTYDIKTSSVNNPSSEWSIHNYAHLQRYGDSQCQTADGHWRRVRLNDATFGTLWGTIPAKCQEINGKEYYYYEDAIGQKFAVTETNACVSYGGDNMIITCIKRPTNSTTTSVVAPFSSTNTSDASASSINIFLMMWVLSCAYFMNK